MNRQTAAAQNHFLLEADSPQLLEGSNSARASRKAVPKTDWRQAGGLLLAAAGALLMAVGWFQLSGTGRTSEQLSYFMSGGLGGAAVLACGIGLLISREHVSDREAVAGLIARIDRLELDLVTELQMLRAEVGSNRHTSDSVG